MVVPWPRMHRESEPQHPLLAAPVPSVQRATASRPSRWARWWLACALALVGCTASDASHSAAQAPAAPKPPGQPNAPAPRAPTVAVPAAPTPPETPVVQAPSAPSLAPNSRVAEALRYDPADPLGNLESADALDRRGRDKPLASVPARGCATLEDPRPVWSESGVANVAASGNEFIVAGYASRAAEERLFVVRLTSSDKLEPVATERLSVPHPGKRVAGPGLAADPAQGVTLAFTDGSGKLRMQHLRASARGASASRELATGVDTRFEPAVAYAKRGALIAYTLGSTPMRSMLARLDQQDQLIASHDITPAAMGAAAPAFVAGATPPMLVTADARSGMSPIARVSLDLEGKPGTPEVAVPVGMMSQPPELASASSGAGTFVGYTGVGSAATSAIGLVQIAPKAGAPQPLVKGTAYGALHLDAAAGSSAVYFVADAPLTGGKEPKHEIHLVRVDARGAGPVLRIQASAGDATHAAIARAPDGTLAVTFTAPDGVYLVRARCED